MDSLRRTDGWVDGRTQNGRTDGGTVGRMDERTDGRADRWMDERMGGRTDGWTDRGYRRAT